MISDAEVKGARASLTCDRVELAAESPLRQARYSLEHDRFDIKDQVAHQSSNANSDD